MTHPFPTRRSSGLPAVDGRLPRVERARGRGIELAHPRIELSRIGRAAIGAALKEGVQREVDMAAVADAEALADLEPALRSEEHTSELQSLMRISYAVFCLKKKK